MSAVILAAGQGTRLRPLTDDRPKCLVELAGRSLIDRQLAVFRALGVTDLTIVGGYRVDQLAACGARTIMNPDFATTNMVASLFCARAMMSGAGDVIVSYGDIVFEQRVLAALCGSDAPVAVIVDRQWRALWEARMEDCLQDAETLKLASDGRIVELGKKPHGYADIEGQYIGLMKFRADYAARLPAIYDTLLDGTGASQAARTMYLTDFLQRLIDDDWPVHAVPIDGGWLEVDTVQDLAIYHQLQRDGQLARLCRLA
ncbi:MAG: phosphocholine cytidylyltransferase family protein [Deltaproteobacteria bacterium]|nr:phosphocholine cytidylyltransferase family protein [Deltaproteobacteria bacterium]